MPRYSTITRAQLDELNAFALSEAPAAQQNLTNRLAELSRDSSIGGLGLLPKSGSILVTNDTIPNIRHLVELEAMLDFPEELQHPAEQVAVCLEIMARHERLMANKSPVVAAVPYEAAQRRLSHLLVEYPILMDGRVHFAVSDELTGQSDWLTAHDTIATLCLASLPSQTHGLSPKQLRLFAGNPSVRSGFKSELLYRKMPHKALPVATRSALLVSALHLNSYSIDICGRDLLGLSASRWASHTDEFYKKLATVVWGVATGDDTSVTREALLEALHLRSPLARTGRQAGSCDEYDLTVATARGTGAPKTQELVYMMSQSFDHHIFGTDEGVMHPPISHRFDTQEVESRTRGVIEFMAQAGCFETAAQAAEWLARGVLGRNCQRQASMTPNCSHEAALGFLEGISAFGVETPEITWTAPVSFSGSFAERSKQAYEGWSTVLEVFARKKSMQKVLGEAQGGGPEVEAVEARRSRRML